MPQRYRLSLDKQLYPFLVLNATGLYQWTPGWTTTDGVETTIDNQRWNVFASLLVGPPDPERHPLLPAAPGVRHASARAGSRSGPPRS